MSPALESYWDSFCFWTHEMLEPDRREQREVNEAWAMYCYLLYVKHGGRKVR